MFLDDVKMAVIGMDERLKTLTEQAQEAMERGNEGQLEDAVAAIHRVLLDKDEARGLVTKALDQQQGGKMDELRGEFAKLSRDHTKHLKKTNKQLVYEQQQEDAIDREVIARTGQASRNQLNKLVGGSRVVAGMSPERLSDIMDLINAKNKVAAQEEASLLKRIQATVEKTRTSNKDQKDKE
jgi:hypothetical protein